MTAVVQTPQSASMAAEAAIPEVVAQTVADSASRIEDVVRAVIAYGIFGFGVLFPFALVAYIEFFRG